MSIDSVVNVNDVKNGNTVNNVNAVNNVNYVNNVNVNNVNNLPFFGEVKVWTGEPPLNNIIHSSNTNTDTNTCFNTKSYNSYSRPFLHQGSVQKVSPSEAPAKCQAPQKAPDDQILYSMMTERTRMTSLMTVAAKMMVTLLLTPYIPKPIHCIHFLCICDEFKRSPDHRGFF